MLPSSQYEPVGHRKFGGFKLETPLYKYMVEVGKVAPVPTVPESVTPGQYEPAGHVLHVEEPQPVVVVPEGQ